MKEKKVNIKVYLKSGQAMETNTYDCIYSFREFLRDEDKMGSRAKIYITGHPTITVLGRYVVGMEWEEASDE